MIYAIHAVGTEFVKFGISSDPWAKKRRGELQVGCPFELVLLACTDWPDRDERRIHKHLHATRVRGEWFKLDERAQFIIDALHDGIVGRHRFMNSYEKPSTHKRLGAVLDFVKHS